MLFFLDTGPRSLLSLSMFWIVRTQQSGNRLYICCGIAKIATAAGCALWWIVDVVLLATNSLSDGNGAPLFDDM